ncbi:E3 ubiquitin-protein like [Actinidia chinensis var. chinensis]|uniref:E3 ubiquitin-protein like n=1 Tax=Actinidia chinensis var. chinensis TaxID=1590841 RepID=A0A2R6RRC9_ACTCC|nr:E3 ubiquitin-protein like [Actinidia chinensis var. chinensis]
MATADKTHVDLSTAGGSGGGSSHSTAAHGGETEIGSSISSGNEIVGVPDRRRESSASECSVEVVDLEAGDPQIELHLSKHKRDCRICHLSMDATNQESGVPMELGCSCKDDLAAAHKQCAEAWFKIKGNKTCEICGSTARNVPGATEAELLEQWNEANDSTIAAAVAPMHSSETQNFWQGHRFLNFLLACMVFAFVISWLFHFNVPS